MLMPPPELKLMLKSSLPNYCPQAAATLVGPGDIIDEPTQPRDDEFTIEASKDHEAVTCDYEGVRVVPSAALPRLRGSRGSPARVAIVIPLRHLL